MQDPSTYRERLYDAFGDRSLDVEARIESGLATGTDYLGVEIGFLTRIEDGRQEIVQSTGGHDLLQPGNSCPLDEAYCQRTVESDSTVSIQAVGEGGVIPQIAIDRFGLDSYIGARVEVDGDLYGTVCFADREHREHPFDEAEQLFVELLSELVGQAFERESYRAEMTRQNDRLRAEKERFEGIADASFDVLFRLDQTATFTYVSPAVDRVLGYDPSALVGERFETFLAESALEDGVEAFERVLGGEVVEGLEMEFRSVEGSLTTLDINARPVETDAEDGASVQGVARDVTARRERERDLRLKNRAMDEADMGIVISDATGEDNPITYVNDGFVELTGYERDEVLGQNCRMLQGPDSDADVIAALRAAIETAEPIEVELVNYRADGRPFWNEIGVTPVTGPDGDLEQYVGFQRDVTERKRRQRLLDVLNRVLRHNLRNKMMLLGAQGPADQAGPPREVVDETVGELLSLADTARELYEVAQSPTDPERVDPGELVRSVADDVAEGAHEASVTVDVRSDRDVCATPSLERAVRELLTNAVEHSPSGVTVDVEVVDADDTVAVRVVDDGPGISEMDAAMVDGADETQLAHGSGLGLWLVNWIVTQYGGSFRIEPRSDATGTVAEIELLALDANVPAGAVDARPTLLSN